MSVRGREFEGRGVGIDFRAGRDSFRGREIELRGCQNYFRGGKNDSGEEKSEFWVCENNSGEDKSYFGEVKYYCGVGEIYRRGVCISVRGVENYCGAVRIDCGGVRKEFCIKKTY